MFLTRRFYIALVLVILLLGSGYVFAPFFVIGQWALFVLLLVVLADVYSLYRIRGIRAFRQCADRFSNGDENEVSIRVESSYPHPVSLEIIDEIPFIFQKRDVDFQVKLGANEGKTVTYRLRPTHRGVYSFGHIRVFVTGKIGFISRRYTCAEPLDIKVYPSYLMLHQYELLAISDNLTELGIKRIRRVGHHTEFEQIKEYVKGDDYRTINWKASARRHELMVNVYQDERSQQIYNVIDKGRVMQQAFRGMTLLDYAINASLVLSYVAMRKEDKAGLVTFDEHFDTFVPASKQPGYMQTLLESLYSQQTTFGETDFSALCVHLNKAAELIRGLCKKGEAAVHFLVGGTQANLTVISALLRPHQAAVCVETGHINVHETGAIERYPLFRNITAVCGANSHTVYRKCKVILQLFRRTAVYHTVIEHNGRAKKRTRAVFSVLHGIGHIKFLAQRASCIDLT